MLNMIPSQLCRGNGDATAWKTLATLFISCCLLLLLPGCATTYDIIVASEPISHEDWQEALQDSVYQITPEFTLRAERL